MSGSDDFEARFAQALAQTPDLPDYYGEIIRRIKRKSAIMHSAWAVAASLVISLTALMFITHARQAISPDVAEEVQSIRSHVTGDDIREELVSCSLIEEDIF